MKPEVALRSVLNQAVTVQQQLAALSSQVEAMVRLATAALELRQDSSDTDAPVPEPVSAGLQAFGDTLRSGVRGGKQACPHTNLLTIEVMGGVYQMCDDCEHQLP